MKEDLWVEEILLYLHVKYPVVLSNEYQMKDNFSSMFCGL